MRKLTAVLVTTLLAASAPQAEDGLEVRYRDLSGRMSLTVSHDIEVGHPIADRKFSFELNLSHGGYDNGHQALFSERPNTDHSVG